MPRRKIHVDGGSFAFPYYEFSGKGSKEASGFKLKRGNKYTFDRLSGSTSHPFYLTDSITGGAPSGYLEKRISGDGGVSGGITGSEEFTLKIGKKFRLDTLYYFCTSHPSDMLHSFSVVDKKKKIKRRADEPSSWLESPQGNKNYREMEDTVASGDFDPCSSIVCVRAFVTKSVS